ncbi:hypothetical protein GE061_016352 [Apolygus lucorum]|uniref:DNA-directed DNA polymerase n=1 Tax=Apolygus lucorum TaxID=248454 RepID=A0A8S9XG05_APOLU|nr:hypothetical protein GE061_016352 [Apolygus lucorum]
MGKTLVAEILTFQTVLERKKKVIIILPFVSVVREKMLYFQDLLVGSGVRVEGFMGSYNPPGGFRAVHVAICTIEKANSLINRLLEENNFDNIGCVVVDELHLLGDPHRGYLLELLLTKLKYISKKGLCPPIQIVGMSATLPNLDVLAKWLNATLYKTDFRPIPLIEFIKVNRSVYKATDLTSSETFQPAFTIDNDPGDTIYLCIDTILKGYSVLVFCPTKNWCETLALQVAGEVKRLGCSNTESGVEIRKQLNSEAISDTLQQLKNSPVGLESVLGKCVSFGVAYHHAGLTLDERDIVEGGFRRSVLRVLVATSTLSSGVNLPARRVIIRSPLFNGRMMDILSYKQMVGRAGRMGKDTAGESYLLCTDEQKSQGQRLVTSELPSVESCLGHSDLSNSLKRAVLEVVASGLISSYEEVRCYTNCTLLAAYEDSEKIDRAVQKCVKYLSTKGFIEIKNETEISVSSLAEACLSASMTPDQGLALLAELDKARKCFVLDSDLHAVYQVTPFSVSNQWSLDWMKAFSMWEALPKNVQKIGELVGVDERFLIKAMRGTMNFQADNQVQKIAVHKRFFTALALQDLINEVPLNKVAEKYGCNKGVLQSLQQSAATFSGMVTNFCRKLSWGAMEVVVSQLGQRIQFGAHRDLLDLLRLECMTGAMARGLYNCEITSVTELARASVKQVCTAIRKALPYPSSEDPGKRKERRDIYLPGRPGLTELEAAELFRMEARTFLMREMGIEHVNWNESQASEEEPIGTVPDCKTGSKIEGSQDSLDLTVSSADFNNINTSPDLKIGLADNKAATSTQLPVAAEIKVGDFPVEVVESVVEKDADKNDSGRDDVSSKDDGDSDENESEEMKPSKLSSLLNISNPCIPKLDVSLRSSYLEAELEGGLSEEVVPTSQEVQPSQFNTMSKTKGEDEMHNRDISRNDSLVQNEEESQIKDVTDYNNLQFSNFSKAFDSTFAHNSPAESGNSIMLKLNPTIKSSTPFNTPESKITAKTGDLTFLELKKLESVSSILGITTIKSDTSFCTPVGRFSDAKQGRGSTMTTVKESPTVSELSEADMFADSGATDSRLSYSMLCAIHSDQPLEELDCNMGGDSILLASQVIESQKDVASSRGSLKRPSCELESAWKRPAKKRCTLSLQKSRVETSPIRVSGISNFFTESLVLDTQVINVADDNSSPLPIFPAEKKTIEPVKSPPASVESKSVVPNPLRNSMTDSYLAEAFQDSFKPSEQTTTLVPGTPEDMFESLINITVVPRDHLNPTASNEVLSHGSNSQASIQSSASPRKTSCKSSLMSPSKYPSVGVSVVKCTKSPGSPAGVNKKYSHFRSESAVVSSCKKSLILPSITASDIAPGELRGRVVDSPMAEPLPTSKSSTSSKRFKKAKSETWGNHFPVDEDLITGDEPELSSAPSSSATNDPLGCSGRGNVPSANNFVEICDNSVQVKKFVSHIKERKEAAFFLETTKCISNGNKIGMRIVKSKSEKTPDFHVNNIGIVGMYFSTGNEILHCCLRSSKCICIDAVKSIFQSKAVTLVGFDLSWQLKLLYQCCEISPECKLWDVSVADWLLNPSDEKSSLKQMVSE